MTLKEGDIFYNDEGSPLKVLKVYFDASFLASYNLEEEFKVDEKHRYEAFNNVNLYAPKTTTLQPSYVGQDGANGMKYDNGKVLASIIIDDFPRALNAVAQIATYGANKYARSSWTTVPDAETRYRDAMVRHQLAFSTEGLYSIDEESGLLHLAHFAWNALAILELQELKKDKSHSNN